MFSLSASWVAEALAFGRISVAVTVTMLAQLALGTVETLLVARLGTDVLAGVFLASGLYLLVFLFALGTVTAVTPLAAAAMGRGDHSEAYRIGQTGLLLGLTFSLPGMALLLTLAASLGSILGDGPEVSSAADYLLGAAFGLPAWVSYVALRCLAVATNAVRITTVAMLAGVPAHAALAAWLILGGAHLPPLGALGAGLAHAATGYLVLALLAAVLRRRPGSGLGAALRICPSWDRGRYLALLRLGVPFACRILLREGIMPAATLLLVPFGPAAVASHAVAARIADLLGVVAFGFSEAANARVGQALGAGRPDRINHSARIALQLSVLVGGTIAAVVLLMPATIASAFLWQAPPAQLQAVVLLLPAVAVLLLLEIVMAAAGGALNGLRDASGPLVITIIGTWLVGLPLGLLLASTIATPTLGLWVGLLAGTTLTALLLFLRLRAKVNSC